MLTNMLFAYTNYIALSMPNYDMPILLAFNIGIQKAQHSFFAVHANNDCNFGMKIAIDEQCAYFAVGGEMSNSTFTRLSAFRLCT
jgi:hypothetical protein